MAWLKGGPFLEVSFFLAIKQDLIREIIDKLSDVRTKIEVIDKNIEEIINNFNEGCPYDPDSPESVIIHSVDLRTIVHLPRKRKATLHIKQVSSNAILVNFWFFGSSFDAPEWNQVGIKENELSDFTFFLEDLFETFDFKIGGIAIEEDILQIFEYDETYPNECYKFENINLKQHPSFPSYFYNVIWNEKYQKLDDIPFNYQRINKQGIMIMLSTKYTEF
ncbi:hypothetical protein BACCIP111895_00185 [Neobacillus rhizosphaerae]|uniref:Uncharacterized protein n=1 Tax=Neobacillus rhizosphaerae TaxID=2880965 RepID=A0ABM9EKE3_9BACI|nr:hypothetical protein [Neobacillus rhizosphaerae]CAH2713052.1 hypothetical protein BACCIP111895_00185 [Neobacillus rhizosphaerae]